MIKAMKKLKKYWPRKKRRKRTYHEPYCYHPPPPTTCHSCCCSSSASAPQPSAPPLPPWLDPYHTYEPISTPVSQPFPEMVFPSKTQFPSQDSVAEAVDICPITVSDSAAAAASNTSSYQQYMVPEPVYGFPVVKTPGKERSSGFFGCFIDFGLNLIRCFCPCFHIREVTQGNRSRFSSPT